MRVDRKENSMNEAYQSLSHSLVGLQVSRGVCAEAAAQNVVWEYPAETRRGLSRTGPAEGVSDRRRALAAGPRAHLHRDSAEVRGGVHRGVSEGEKCHRDRSGIRRQGTELHG